MTDHPQRIVSLDAFRGATIAGMIVVNTPGSPDHVYPQLKHAAWHGWTFADWIFPFFLFIVGVAMTFSFAKRGERGVSTRRMMVDIVRRSAILFGLGLLINGFPFGLNPDFSWGSFRIPGVLQRIAICYLIAGVILLKTGIRGQLLWVGGLLAAYWVALKIVPVPGSGSGILEPEGNLVWYMDWLVLKGHTWQYAPVSGFDPEGIASTFPAVGSVLVGCLTGEWLRSARASEEKAGWMFVAGLFLLLVGVSMDIWMPINKNLWTSSSVVFTSGWGLLCFGSFFWLIDVKGGARWFKPFTIFGMNAIAIYVLSELLWSTLWAIRWEQMGELVFLEEVLFNNGFAIIGDLQLASLIFSLGYLVLMFVVSWGMWRMNWFVKV